MTYSEAIQFLYDLRLFGLKPGLENTFKLAVWLFFSICGERSCGKRH